MNKNYYQECFKSFKFILKRITLFLLISLPLVGSYISLNLYFGIGSYIIISVCCVTFSFSYWYILPFLLEISKAKVKGDILCHITKRSDIELQNKADLNI